MTDIRDVPYKDIKEFVLRNKGKAYKLFEDEEEIYDIAFELLSDENSIGHPTSLIEWMLAYNLIVNEIIIDNYSTYDIDKMDQKGINELAKLLGMKKNNRENIKNILRYLGKLDFLPEHTDVKPLILDTILKLKILDSGLDDVIQLFKNNKHLRKFIYDNMHQIINKVSTKNTGDNMNKDDARLLSKFIFDLMKLNEFVLVKEALKIASRFTITIDFKSTRRPGFFLDYLTSQIGDLTYYVLTSLETNLIVKYFDLFDYINLLGRHNIISEFDIRNMLINPKGLLLENQPKFLPSIFEAALIKDKTKILKVIYHFWWFEQDINRDFAIQMKDLVKEYERKFPERKYS